MIYEMWKKINGVFVGGKYVEKWGHLFELLLVINKKGYGKS